MSAELDTLFARFFEQVKYLSPPSETDLQLLGSLAAWKAQSPVRGSFTSLTEYREAKREHAKSRPRRPKGRPRARFPDRTAARKVLLTYLAKVGAEELARDAVDLDIRLRALATEFIATSR